jgi:hypothetical protein
MVTIARAEAKPVLPVVAAPMATELARFAIIIAAKAPSVVAISPLATSAPDEYERSVGLQERQAHRLGAGLRCANRQQRRNWHDFRQSSEHRENPCLDLKDVEFRAPRTSAQLANR